MGNTGGERPSGEKTGGEKPSGEKSAGKRPSTHAPHQQSSVLIRVSDEPPSGHYIDGLHLDLAFYLFPAPGLDT